MYNFSAKYNCKINKSYFSQFHHRCWQTYFVVLSETLFYVLYSINSDISVLAGRVFHFSHNWSWWFFSIGLTKATLTVVCSVGVCFCLPTKEQKKCSKGPKLSKKSHFRLALGLYKNWRYEWSGPHFDLRIVYHLWKFKRGQG